MPPTVAGDARSYLAMAADPAAVVHAPFGYRVLLPWAVHLLGGGPGAFVGLSVLLTATFTGCMFLAAPGGRRVAWIVWAFALVSPAAFFGVRNPYLVDPLLYASLAAGLVLLRRGRLVAVAVLLAVAALGKEVVLFAVPACAWTAVRARRWQAAVLVCALPSAALLLIRTTVAVTPAAPGGPAATAALVLAYHRHLATDVLVALAVGLGPLLLLAIGGWRAADPTLRLWTWTIALFAVVSTPLVTDWYRVVSLSTLGTVPLLAGRRWTAPTLVVGLVGTAVTSGVGQLRLAADTKVAFLAAACLVVAVPVLAEHLAAARARRALSRR